MWRIIVGNIIVGISAYFFITSVHRESKEEMAKYQTIEAFINGAGSLILGGVTGTLTNWLASLRNYTVWKKINSKPLIVAISIALVVLGVILNKEGLIGYLPIIASLLYTVALFSNANYNATRVVLSINAAIWLVYNVSIHDYVSTVIHSLLIVNTYKCLFMEWKLKRKQYQVVAKDEL